MPRKSPRDIPELSKNIWKKGQSGNPKGRPKKKTIEMLVEDVLGEKVPNSDANKRELMARIFVDEMLQKRNTTLIKEYLDRAWPKKQQLELSGEVNQPERVDVFTPEEDDQQALLDAARAEGQVH